MSELQPQTMQLQPITEQLLDIQEMQFWLDKAVAWGPADRPDSQRDTCLHLSKLRDFLHQLSTHISSMSSTAETMKRFPLLGQLLGRLCWNPHVTADAPGRRLLLQCLWSLYSEHPGDAVERKANQWIRNVLRQLTTEEEADTAAHALMKQTGVSPQDYHLRVLNKMVEMLQDNIGKSCRSLGNTNERCSCDHILTTSEACIPLVTCPEAAPLIGALLQQPVTCVRAALSEDFLDACLALDEQAVISLWFHHLPSLEEAVLSLLEENLTSTWATLQESLLPKACAQHCSIFFVVNDIFRSVLMQSEGNERVKFIIQTFTRCFLREMKLQEHQMSLKTFFPQSPPSLLVPLFTCPSEMPPEAWRRHLDWISSLIRRLTEEEEEGDDKMTASQLVTVEQNHLPQRAMCMQPFPPTKHFNRRLHGVFEFWFLLVQGGHWVQVASQLLVTSRPEDMAPLLWLLTFYHHPSRQGHHRDLQLVRCREACSHMHAVFSAPPLPVDGLQALVALLRPPSPSAGWILKLLVHFAVFSQQSLSRSRDVLQTVVDQAGLLDEAVSVLSSLKLRLKEGHFLSSETDNVQLRINALQQILAH